MPFPWCLQAYIHGKSTLITPTHNTVYITYADHVYIGRCSLILRNMSAGQIVTQDGDSRFFVHVLSVRVCVIADGEPQGTAGPKQAVLHSKEAV